MLTLKIINGTLIDGSGNEPRRSDVGVTGDSITAIGDLSEAEASRTIDAGGSVVCPGFIDVHTHSDTYLLIEPTAPSKLHQGITTEVCGNCGASAAPVSSFEHLPSDWADKDYPTTWSTMAEYRSLIEKQGIGVNVAMLVGHNTLRRSIVGYDNRPATGDELAEMIRMTEESFEAGAHGITTGLVYAPGMFAPREEIVALASIAARYDGLYGSHMRSEGDALLEAIEEAMTIGREAGTRVQISHLKVAGRTNWHKRDEALAMIRSARERGERVASDRYPYTAGATDLDVVFPEWAAAGGRAAILERLSETASCERLRSELVDSRPREDWGGVLVGSTTHPDNTRFRGQTLIDVANQLELPHPVDAILHLCRTDELKTGAFFAGMSEENMRHILKEPYVMLGSDASLRALTGPLSHDYPHPRAYGSMPRFLRMAIDEALMPLPEAIRKMTSLPAEQFQLKKRGIIQTGYAADIVVFDSESIQDHATYGNPHALSTGITDVILNGVQTLSNGSETDQLPGRVV
ncbi:MAG: D-aminoacylase [Verrucomicrobia bacterium]|nr:D-aminoacylase [Verrucomicrobiota bacterium]